MVLVIIFLTLTNIALGYGLAIYVNRNFGTLVFTLPKKRKVKPGATVDSSEAVAAVATLPSQPIAQIESTPEQVISAAGIIETPATEIAVSDQVDEEHVLAGIEEFRSQLAKISESAEPIAEPERELVGAAN